VPELPEVETIVGQLGPKLSGSEIVSVCVADPRWCNPTDPAAFARSLEGRRIAAIGRRGKYLLWRFADGSVLLQHLRMSGVILVDPPQQPPHLRAVLRLMKDGKTVEVAICDLRRFGTASLFPDEAAAASYLSKRLGPEPFDPALSPAYLRQQLRNRRVAIKVALLDQRVVAGVGNIYADEALFRAGIDPARPSASLTAQECAALLEGLRAALAAGIDARGASIENFRGIDGVRGSFQNQFLVHRREGKPCPRCGSPIHRLRLGVRSTYLCPHCQRGCSS